MKDRTPFALGGLWENWRHPQSGEWIRTFVILTVPANELVAQIHDRMPLILPKTAYNRWLGEEADPKDLLVPFPAEPMTMWPVSTRVSQRMMTPPCSTQRPDNFQGNLKNFRAGPVHYLRRAIACRRGAEE